MGPPGVGTLGATLAPAARSVRVIGCALGYRNAHENRRSVTLGAVSACTKYSECMTAMREYLVSSSGQMSLPASARHRWNLDRGGPVDVIDLGFGVLTVPKGQGRRLLNDLLSRDEHATFVRSLEDDPDLATT